MPAPEALFREKIDRQLEAAGWVAQDRDRLNLYAGSGVAGREFPVEESLADDVRFVPLEGRLVPTEAVLTRAAGRAYEVPACPADYCSYSRRGYRQYCCVRSVRKSVSACAFLGRRLRKFGLPGRPCG